TRRAEEFLAGKPEIVSQITTVGQSSDGFGAALAPAYKAEITVQLVEKKYREDDSNIYAAKIKRELEQILVGAKVKTVPISIVGFAEQAPVEMVVIGSDLDSVMRYAEAALGELQKIPGTSETKLSVESGNPEIIVE